MGTTSTLLRDQALLERNPIANEASASGVSWPAVFAGASITCGLTLALLALGAGLGLSTISPWSRPGSAGGVLTSGAIVWLILNEIIASAMGGYLAGRLRTKWTAIHNDEVYFRDTAHGFLVWALSVVITAAFLGAAATAMVGGAPGEAASTDARAANTRYYVDTLLRSGQTQAGSIDGAVSAEIDRILTRSLTKGEIPSEDRTYLGEVVAHKSGLNQAEADKRVSDVFERARLDLDATRKAAAHLLLWLFLALFIGAFSASYAATIGGRQRDHLTSI